VDFDLHSSNTSIHYWKSEGKDVHRLREEIVGCSPNNNGKGKMATGDGILYGFRNTMRMVDRLERRH
jgi:hypothetical protein